MQKRLKSYDVVRWANDFVDALFRVKAEQEKLNSGWIGPLIARKLIQEFTMSRRRLLLLDYDGSLVPFAEDPHLAAPNPQLLKILRGLLEQSETDVVLISGRDRDTLQSWFGMLPLILVAEHGAWIKEREGNWGMLKPLSNEWKAQILPLLQAHSDRLPGSFVEAKEFSIAWHYRKADPELGPARAKELVDDLVHFTANIDVHVWQGNKVVELGNAGVNKGTAAMYLSSKGNFDFILALGDDWTDEELFTALPKTAHTIRIGVTQLPARFHLHNPSEALGLLEELTTPRPIQ
jgi:trehalose 6-phosphate synthase/phosphatase